MAIGVQRAYKQRAFNLVGLKGLSDKQIEVHLGLYAGYVKNTNLLKERIADLTGQGKTSTPDWAELNRRMGFEYNGMILHEYYFGNLTPNGRGQLSSGSGLGQEIQQSFGSIDAWMADFRGVGTMRGVGWAILFQDPVTGWLSNHWVTLHQDGNPAGFKPILVMDVWEHAFMVDYLPAERSKYIDAFLQNVDWTAVEQRMAQTAALRPIGQ